MRQAWHHSRSREFLPFGRLSVKLQCLESRSHNHLFRAKWVDTAEIQLPSNLGEEIFRGGEVKR